jgi:hypothetical protein
MSDTPIFDKTNPIVSKPLPWWAGYAKAVFGAILAGVLAFLSALLPFMQEGNVITAVGWITAIIAGLTTIAGIAGLVYAVPNRVKE